MHTSNKILAWVALLAGLLISGIAEYFSIVGLSKIFAGAFWPIVVMGCAIGIGKLAGISWLFRYWKLAPKMMVAALSIVVLAVMLITSTGVFGYLSKSYNEVYAPIQAQQIQIDLVKKTMDADLDKVDSNRHQLEIMDSVITTMIAKDKTEQGQVYRNRQLKERNQIAADIKVAQDDYAVQAKKWADLSTETQVLSADVGPVAFIAKSLFSTDSKDAVDQAVKFIIGLLVLTLDPLAIILLLCANYAFTNEPAKVVIPTRTVEAPTEIEPDNPVDEPAERVYYEPVVPDVMDESFLDELDGDDISLAGPSRTRIKRKLI